MLFRFLAYLIATVCNLAAMSIGYYMHYRFALDVGIFAQAVFFIAYTATEATILLGTDKDGGTDDGSESRISEG